MRQAFAWLARRAVVYLLIVLALIAAAVVVPWLRGEWEGARAIDERLRTLEDVRARVDRHEVAATERFARSVRTMRGAGIATIDARLATARARQERLIAGRSTRSMAMRLALDGAPGVLADQRREVEIALASREIVSLERARALALADARLAGLDGLDASAQEAERLRRQCNAAREAVDAFDRRWLGERIWNRRERARLLGTATEVCRRSAQRDSAVRAAVTARRRAIALRRQAAAAYVASTARVADTLAQATSTLDRRIAEDAALARGSLAGRARSLADRIDLAAKMKAAAFILLGIVITPYAIRFFLYFVLAPIAQRRAAIRLGVPGGTVADIPASAPSSTSVAIRQAPHEELLVRQNYLQSTSADADARTRFLLDPRHPMTSVAAGLAFLTRIRGSGEVATVSAVHDQIAEVTVLTLPDGAACILHPRALAAVAQPIDRPMRIASHWRLFTLSAWLTLQFRYLVFHGPARIVVKGGRGVRVENAARGRVFGQHQLVGFSTDLAYSVTRAETFWPYFLGREHLLKDRVEGAGLLVIEEAPMAGQGTGRRTGGLEGAIDAGMKLFGL